MFEPYLKSFFVHASDPTNIKLLKVRPLTDPTSARQLSEFVSAISTLLLSPPQLDIIANVAGETSIHTILREFRVSALLVLALFPGSGEAPHTPLSLSLWMLLVGFPGSGEAPPPSP